MATMVKEKRREKKRTKEKREIKNNIEAEQPSVSEKSNLDNGEVTSRNITQNFIETPMIGESNTFEPNEKPINTDCTEKQRLEIEVASQSVPKGVHKNLATKSTSICTEINSSTEMKPDTTIKSIENSNSIQIEANTTKKKLLEASNIEDTYENLNSKLKSMTMTSLYPELTDELEKQQNVNKETNITILQNPIEVLENIQPSAPILEEETPEVIYQEPMLIKEVVPKVQCMSCMPLEEAIRLYGGAEIADVRAMSEREEAIVEAGPVSGPEHPLVDLLSTFRSSLIAVDRERTQLTISFIEEERFRSTLWRVEKRKFHVTEKCPCGATVHLSGSYEHAELMKEKLPVARMKLEGLLRDVQDSYCHHQHAALLAHCQIEELISEIIQSNKNEIREALSLVLQALRSSDGAPEALATALQRWARVLTAALLDGRDLRQLLHLLHHLFKQIRSVRWAASVIHLNVGDRVAAAQSIALLDLLLARPRLEPALECTEDAEEEWEEVDKRGGGGAVSDGTLRERDLLALLHAFPLRDLAARLVLFTHADIKQARDYEWGDNTGGGGVLRACCGVRALLATLQRSAHAHPHYERLHAQLRALAASTLRALAGLHLQSRDTYAKDLRLKLTAELEASFSAGLTLFGTHDLHKLPATLLSDYTAKDYCTALIVGLHDKSRKRLECLSIELPVLPCEERVRMLACAAIDRTDDNELAKMVLDFLFQTGIKRKIVVCKGTCDATAKEYLPKIFAVHPYLHTIAFHTLAELNQGEPADPSSAKALSADTWRPTQGEIRAVLDDWAQRCPLLIQYLLLDMDYTPHVGISLDTQLAIGSWLCIYLRQSSPTVTPEWAWRVLRRLRVHRACWGEPLDAPPPEDEPTDLFAMAYAVLASSWGHCIPLICSHGVSALCRVAAARARDAVHCLAPLMLVMAHSPESVSFTPKFTELFSTLLGSGPTLVQRALGLGPAPGSEMLLKLLLTQLDGKRSFGVSRSAILSAWLHALWRPALSTGAILDTALLACREWSLFDTYAGLLLQEENAKEHISHAIRGVSQAPLICECMLRNAHAHREARTQLFARLTDVLHLQRIAGDRIHVDNALKHIGANISSEELVIYRTAAAVLAAPLQHPSHLTLWRLFFHLYLQRPPNSLHESIPPVGPLFFSGLIKSRTLSQLRKRLSDTALHHHNEVEALKSTKEDQSPKTQTTSKRDKTNSATDDLLPALSIIDLRGESSESSDSESSSEGEKAEGQWVTVESSEGNDVANLLAYHVAAEKMFREYMRWLDEGDKARAMPHHADIARFIPEHALEAAWRSELSRRRLPASPDDEDFPLPSVATPRPPAPVQTPFQNAISSILGIKDRSRKCLRKPRIKSPLEEVNFKDTRALLNLVDKHLTDIERLAKEWSSEASRVSSLDSKLWELVSSLRARRPLPAVKKSCEKKCKPITFVIPDHEWLISTDAERGIKENRANARVSIRRLARPRPHAARTAATLHSIARRMCSSDAASRAAERGWRCAGAGPASHCAPAHAALTALLADLAERWLCQDGKLCAELLSRWGSNSKTPLQQSLCGSLVSPRRMPPADWPLVYMALLRAKLPPHAVFSYLSKFEMSRWSETADPTQRRDLLEALVTAAQRWGMTPDLEHHVLLELIGVHTATIINAPELCAHIARCARVSTACALPPQHWPHIVRAVERCARQVPFDQLGHLLRELGVIWWEARAGLQRAGALGVMAAYAPHVASLMHALQRAFVASGKALTYAPEKLGRYAWSTLQESWAAWISPHPATPPLLPSTVEEEFYTPMLKHFVDNVHQIMLDCPGTEEYLLQQIFEWTIKAHLSVLGAHASQESRIQMSALLAELANLPWGEHQWFGDTCFPWALQICTSNDKEITSWCNSTARSIVAETWLRGATHDDVAARLATLLYLFTTDTYLPTLEEAARLPWYRFPEVALEEALDRFFAQYHNSAQPYHDLPQFRVLLLASELIIQPGTSPQQICVSNTRQKRARAVSQWVRAACVPALLSHVAAATQCVLDVVTDALPYLECCEGEAEELLSRAAIIMCMEPAAAAALPVWEKWVKSSGARATGACLSAASVLTAFEYFAALADCAVRAHLMHTETPGWSEICHRWRNCHWTEAAPLAVRTRLHAAYGVARVHVQPPGTLRTAFLGLLAANINFVDNEVIIALWICYACRVARESGAEGEAGECGAGARGVLARWGDEPRRSLLSVVTMQADTGQPTAKHRLLCRLAQCILTRDSEPSIRAYEASCAAVLGSTPDVLSWGRAPHPRRLPRLAMRLYPSAEKYFKDELDLAPEDR